MTDRVGEAARELVARLDGQVRGRVCLDAPLAPLTTYHLGGPARVLVEAESSADLDLVAEHWDPAALPLLVVGRGSNILVADAGFAGLALRLAGGLSWAREDGEVVRAGGATPMPWLARWAARRGRGGLGFGVAVPGSVGGAVRMNAGAHGTETKDVLEQAEVVDLEGATRRCPGVDELGLSYRHSDLGPSEVVEAAAFRLTAAEPALLEEEMRTIVRWRKEHQPGGQPNAGSMFRNPAGDAAGRLIEAVGAKGWREGGAEVSTKHANFFVAHSGARATDVVRLLARVRRAVQSQFGVVLHPEVRLVGDYPPDLIESLLEDEG